jgi:hypothetical protein
VRIDLHCHSNRYSTCSSLAPADLARAAREAGLDAICLTEHDRLWPDDDLRRLSDQTGILVLCGMEVTTELGHVLVFGVRRPPPLLYMAESLVAVVHAEGGLAVLAHPARAGQPVLPSATRRELFDTVEILNGSDGPEQNAAAAGLVHGHALPGIAGSDCHSPAEVGSVATVLPGPVRDVAELVAVLRLGQHVVERLRTPEG